MQKIVDLKGSEKAMAEWEYASSIQELRKEEARLEELIAQRRQTELQLESALVSKTTLARMNELQVYAEWLDERIGEQRRGVSAAEQIVVSRQRRLADKMVDEKVWLNSRERAYGRYLTESLAQQQNELDEIALVRAAAASRK
jgi:flagellar protein FliJ